jgi:DsbC/DsbD-like thiol-disulfide interchange protein
MALVPDSVAPGGTVDLTVRVKTAPTWHIYAVDNNSDIGIPTSLKLESPRGIEPIGEWTTPKAILEKSDVGDALVYEGDFTFRRSLKVAAGTATGPLAVKCEFRYQACNPSACLPPRTLTLQATATIAPNP